MDILAIQIRITGKIMSIYVNLYQLIWEPPTYILLQTLQVFNIITDNQVLRAIPAGNYMFKVINRNTRTRCEICSKYVQTFP